MKIVLNLMLTARQLFHNVEERHKKFSSLICELLMQLKVVPSPTDEPLLDGDRQQLIINDCIGGFPELEFSDATPTLPEYDFDEAPTISESISSLFAGEFYSKETYYETST
jgi:hypothetical protein